MDNALMSPSKENTSKKSGGFSNIVRTLSLLLSHEDKSSAEKPLSDRDKIMREIEDTLAELRQTKNCFENAKDPEIIEACVYKIKSGEARYSFLLRKAKLLGENSTKISI